MGEEDHNLMKIGLRFLHNILNDEFVVGCYEEQNEKRFPEL